MQPSTPENVFSTLPLCPELLTNLQSLDFVTMTPIQALTLPVMLQGKDVIAQAKTGSGKTAAFGLLILNKLVQKNFSPQAVILCPTRELAEQVSQVLRQLARLLPNIKILNLSGGLPMRPQMEALRHGIHIIVGTPGRIMKHLDKQLLSLDQLQTLVLDEADRMLDMGFIEAIEEILNLCPKARQTLLFSATYGEEIKNLAQKFMQNPHELQVEEEHTQQDIEQHFYEVNSAAEKFSLLKSILLHYQPSSTLVFCNTKSQTEQLFKQLTQSGFSAIALNGDMEQLERDTAMILFTNGSRLILIATDVAARGLDITELGAVINYDLAFEQDVHLHRVGRTGRAGKKGLAFSITTPNDAERIMAIENKLAAPIVWGTISDLSATDRHCLLPAMATLRLNTGKKDKIRPGDILGALTKDAGLPVAAIGKIKINTTSSFVAIACDQLENAYRYFTNGKLKGRAVGVKKI